jgi:hypothetical protein
MQTKMNTLPAWTKEGMPYPSGRRPIRVMREGARPVSRSRASVAFLSPSTQNDHNKGEPYVRVKYTINHCQFLAYCLVASMKGIHVIGWNVKRTTCLRLGSSTPRPAKLLQVVVCRDIRYPYSRAMGQPPWCLNVRAPQQGRNSQTRAFTRQRSGIGRTHPTRVFRQAGLGSCMALAHLETTTTALYLIL